MPSRAPINAPLRMGADVLVLRAMAGGQEWMRKTSSADAGQIHALTAPHTSYTGHLLTIH